MISSTRLRNSGRNCGASRRDREFHPLVAALGRHGIQDAVAADVGGHDDDGVLEVDGAALAVGQAAVVEDLQQDVEDVGVGLFDFVEKDDAVGPAADGFGELAAFLEADVAGRRADQAGDGVLLLVLGHVDADHGVLVVEEKLGERARQFGFADAGGAQEDEAADGPVGVLEAGAGALHGIGDGLHGFVLADHAVVKLFGQVQELLQLAFEQFGDGDAGPAADDFGDVLFVHFFLEQALGSCSDSGRSSSLSCFSRPIRLPYLSSAALLRS